MILPIVISLTSTPLKSYWNETTGYNGYITATEFREKLWYIHWDISDDGLRAHTMVAGVHKITVVG